MSETPQQTIHHQACISASSRKAQERSESCRIHTLILVRSTYYFTALGKNDIKCCPTWQQIH